MNKKSALNHLDEIISTLEAFARVFEEQPRNMWRIDALLQMCDEANHHLHLIKVGLIVERSRREAENSGQLGLPL